MSLIEWVISEEGIRTQVQWPTFFVKLVTWYLWLFKRQLWKRHLKLFNNLEQIENAVDSGIREAEEIVQTEVEDLKKEEEAASTEKVPADDVITVDEADKSSTEKVEDVTSEKPVNVEWSFDDPTLHEPAEGGRIFLIWI